MQRADSFKASEDTHDSVVFPRVRNRINMRACADGGRLRVRTHPASECVTDRIFAHHKTYCLAQFFKPRSCLPVGRSEYDSRYGRRLRVRNRSQIFDLGKQLIGINFKFHGYLFASGCRFQSLYMRYFAGTFPRAPNHCGHQGPIQIKSPAMTGYHESPSR